MGSLYEELGVSSDVSAQELRHAYRERARQLHPDVNRSAEAGEAIRRLNEIWAILGNPERRSRYDASLRSERSAMARGLPPVNHSTSRELRRSAARPLLVILAVLAILFVVTAYAGPHSPTTANHPQVRTSMTATVPEPGVTAGYSLIGKCLLVQPGYDAVVSCSQPNTGQVIAEVAQLSQCPPGSTGYQLSGRAQLVCLIVER